MSTQESETQKYVSALADTIYYEARRTGLTTEKMANDLGLSVDTVRRYLTRKERDIPARHLVDMAHLAGMSMSQVVEETDRRMARDAS